jgi:thiamine-phosphate pyrophosphorylase
VETAEGAGWRPDDLARAYLDGGARVVQIRAKRLGSRPFLELCQAVIRLGEPFDAAIIVNDRADLARMSGAAGVHVGQEDLPPHAARDLVGPRAIVGFSTHTVPQIEQAVTEPVTYVAVGPVFGTQTKNTGYEAVGLERVTAAARIAAGRMPIVAIGGITLERAPAVLAAGASAVAVIADLLHGNDPTRRVAAYCRALL